MIVEALPAARLVELEGASHFSNVDQPGDFNTALLPTNNGSYFETGATDEETVEKKI